MLAETSLKSELQLIIFLSLVQGEETKQAVISGS
jgi:hypothetical protein